MGSSRNIREHAGAVGCGAPTGIPLVIIPRRNWTWRFITRCIQRRAQSAAALELKREAETGIAEGR